MGHLAPPGVGKECPLHVVTVATSTDQAHLPEGCSGQGGRVPRQGAWPTSWEQHKSHPPILEWPLLPHLWEGACYLLSPEVVHSVCKQPGFLESSLWHPTLYLHLKVTLPGYNHRVQPPLTSGTVGCCSRRKNFYASECSSAL